MNIVAWIILGLIAGAIAKAIYPGPQGGGIFATIGLGIVGALVGGYLGQMFLPGSGGLSRISGSFNFTRYSLRCSRCDALYLHLGLSN
jgi:uncharacterized membrane protein YeaQ/YmgE (transglycosylase-associated protein family)